MKEKYNLNHITKTLDKLFKAIRISIKSILAIKLDDLEKIQDVTSVEITIIIELKKAIKNKRIIAFLSCDRGKEE